MTALEITGTASKKEAAGMRKRFPEAEGILDEIRERYEYEDDTYRITVPHTLMEIMLEGNALHHCVASTDRYFERIENRETYIFFLRKRANRTYRTIPWRRNREWQSDSTGAIWTRNRILTR